MGKPCDGVGIPNEVNQLGRLIAILARRSFLFAVVFLGGCGDDAARGPSQGPVNDARPSRSTNPDGREYIKTH